MPTSCGIADDRRVLYILPGNWEDEHESDKAKNTLLWVSCELLNNFNRLKADVSGHKNRTRYPSPFGRSCPPIKDHHQAKYGQESLDAPRTSDALRRGNWRMSGQSVSLELRLLRPDRRS